MAIAWLVSLGSAFQCQFERSRLFQFLSLVIGLAVFGGVMMTILASFVTGLLSIVEFNFLADVTQVQWFVQGAVVGALCGFIFWAHKITFIRSENGSR